MNQKQFDFRMQNNLISDEDIFRIINENETLKQQVAVAVECLNNCFTNHADEPAQSAIAKIKELGGLT